MHRIAAPEPYVPRKSSRRDPWTQEEAREALAAASQSGLSLAAFARHHGLCDRQLYWWHMRIRAHPDVHTGPMSFVPVVQAPPAVFDQGWNGVEVAVGGAVVRVQRDFCEHTLGRIVAVLRRLPC